MHDKEKRVKQGTEKSSFSHILKVVKVKGTYQIKDIVYVGAEVFDFKHLRGWQRLECLFQD